MWNEPPQTSRGFEGFGESPAPEIRAQLERILGHRDFEASGRTRDLLRFLVEETLAGRGHRLKGYTIAVEVFGRAPAFDANLDPIVRIQAGRLRRALEHYYLVAGGGDSVLIGIPKGRYVPTFTRNAAPVGSAVAPSEPPFETLPRFPVGISVAVLPLQEMPADPQNAYLAEGLREDFCHELSRYQDLIVIPCRAEMLPAGAAAEPRELSRRLGTRFILEGSVRRDEEQVKIAAWLIDGSQGRQIWAETYTRPYSAGSLIGLQEDIARNVADAIGGEFGIISQRVAEEARNVAPANLSTYEALLRFYYYEVTLDPEAGRQCAFALRAAVEREPEHGPLWAALATLMQNAYVLDRPGTKDPRGEPAEYARRGAALAPGSQLTRGVLARNYFLCRERAAFLREMEATLRLNPGSPVYLGFTGYSLILADESEQGRPLLEKAIARNPCHPGWFNHALLVDDYMRGDYEGALQQTLKPAFEAAYWGPLLRAAVLGQLGRIVDAEHAGAELVALVPDFTVRARDLTSRAILSEAIVEALLEGLGKAGLRVEAPRASPRRWRRSL